VVGDQWSVISGRWSVVSGRLPVLGGQLTTQYSAIGETTNWDI